MQPSSSTVHSYEAVIRRLRTLAPGESYTYYVGFLDGERINDPLGPASLAAQVAYELMLQGKIALTQKRISHPITRTGSIDWHAGKGDGFKYIATGSIPKPKPKSHFFKTSLFMGDKA